MGFEPTTFCLGSKHSTTELRPPAAYTDYNRNPGIVGSEPHVAATLCRRGVLPLTVLPPVVSTSQQFQDPKGYSIDKSRSFFQVL